LDVRDIAEIFRRSREKMGMADRPEGQMTDIQLLDEREVSRRLSVSVNTLRYWRVSGDGPNYVKLGRLVRYDAVALEKFILRNLRVSKARATTEEKRVAL
jgi:helix-turn-helix protein